jgi:Xaa-Pro aminopeptidase
MDAPARGFATNEFAARTLAAQELMAKAELSALLLTTEPEVRYYTGFLTRFWESPTRPWFVVLPAHGKPIAVIPSIGAHLMGQTWVEDIRTWPAPDYTDDGIGLLSEALLEITPTDGRIGIADKMESHARLPLDSLNNLRAKLMGRTLTGDAEITRTLRMVKSSAEIEKIKYAAGIANRAFDRVFECAAEGTPLSQVFRTFQALCLTEGADWVPYLAGGAGCGGYGDVISPASDIALQSGDVLMLDTGLVWDGYFCDFDRNFSIGPPRETVASAHQQLIEATQAALECAKPGAIISDLFAAMEAVTNPNGIQMDAGRLGHGLGMQLTEWPSIIAADRTPLSVGMVLTLEPCAQLGDGKIMVHEENIVIGQSGAEYLSAPQHPNIRQI